MHVRWDPSLCAQGLEESEEAEADGRVLPAGWFMFRNWPQPAEVQGVQGGPQQERGGARSLPRLLSFLLFQTVKHSLYELSCFICALASS